MRSRKLHEIWPMPWASPFRIALTFALIGGLYIYFSDWIAFALWADPRQQERVQIIKGWAFIGSAAVLIYILTTLGLRAAERSRAAERETQRMLRTLIGNLPGLVYRCANDADWTMTFMDGACRSITGYACEDFLAGRVSFDSLIQPEHRQRLHDEVNAALAAGHSFELIYPIRHADGSTRWLWERGSAVNGSGGHALEGFITDITQLKNAERSLLVKEEQARTLAASRTLLLRELDHRVRNNLAALLSLLSLYEASARDVPRFAQSMRDKIMAMKTVHDLINDETGGRVDLATLLRHVAGQFVDEGDVNRLRFAGPDTPLQMRQLAPLTMILQELMTNSRKHGALAAAAGQVEVTWEIHDGASPRIVLQWRETGAPALPDDAPTGLGLRLIEGFAEHELRGRCTFRFNAHTFDCELTVPLNPAAG